MVKPQIHIQRHSTPCGDLTLGTYRGTLCLCDWTARKHPEAIRHRFSRSLDADFIKEDDATLAVAQQQLDEYFQHKRIKFDIPILMVGTQFQHHVWNELMHIPYGTTVNYAEIARRMNATTSVRAVANAISANAISIFIPCHRVIGSNGSLTGYAGGLTAKRLLLTLEQDEISRSLEEEYSI